MFVATKIFVAAPANDSRAPHLEVSHKRFTIANIAIFSVSEQVHCDLVQLYFVCCVYYRTCYIINIVLLCAITRFNTHTPKM